MFARPVHHAALLNVNGLCSGNTSVKFQSNYSMDRKSGHSEWMNERVRLKQGVFENILVVLGFLPTGVKLESGRLG